MKNLAFSLVEVSTFKRVEAVFVFDQFEDFVEASAAAKNHSALSLVGSAELLEREHLEMGNTFLLICLRAHIEKLDTFNLN